MIRESDELRFYLVTIPSPSGTEEEQDETFNAFLDKMFDNHLSTHETFTFSPDGTETTIEAMAPSTAMAKFVTKILFERTLSPGQAITVFANKYGSLSEHESGSGIANFLEEEKCEDEIVPITELYYLNYSN